ncbi:hypothetical protein BCR32DRAFT_247760 [Anaeromyces robustus]|uniref:TLDc domain-containing protein n=1 Tax=Anaeromyces robustus TaxID=1754192 RepID=A0A1Y1WW86_9FUNG|nr:hypothetical protein BCR32DRAFT_247760 [Anaeromyces robustus]|eukprot:ORX77665.1 hypothetical protein BCR32DRAFT_247760 [Anaeromyces robustus]
MESKDNQNTSNYEVINEEKTILEYLFDKYEIIIQLQKKSKEYFISLMAKKEKKIVNYTYETRMKYEDFEEFDIVLLKLYDNIEKIYYFITDCLKEEKIIISDIGYSELSLLITSKFLGFSEPLSLELNLEKRDCNIDDTIKMLCEKVNELEKENRLIKFQLNNKIFENENDIVFLKNKLLTIPDFYNKKISFNLIYRLSNNGSSGSSFFNKCCNIPNNIILVKTTENERFGGFTQNAWTCNNSYKKDDNAFCFSLTNKKFYDIKKGFDAIFDGNSKSGISFCNFLYIGNTNNTLLSGYCFGRNDNSSDSSNYTGECLKYEINNFKRNFSVNELEFYEIVLE